MMTSFASDMVSNNNFQANYQHNSKFDPHKTKRIILAERESQQLFALSHTEKSEIIIGRRDRLANYTPTLDLALFGGYRLGVSRLHVSIIIENNSVSVIDLDSSNGTSLNDILLDALKPYTLKTGDKLQLGSLILDVVSA